MGNIPFLVRPRPVDADQMPTQLKWRNTMNRLFIFLLMCTIVHTAPSVALAQSKVVWSFSAMAAQPAGIPIRRDLHVSSHGNIRFNSGMAGTIVLICPITDDLDGVRLHSLRLTYNDGDGSQGPARVNASLTRVRRSNGRIASLPNSGVSSNDENAPNSGLKGWATHQSGSSGRWECRREHQLRFQRANLLAALRV
jgi:hypothetical protein